MTSLEIRSRDVGTLDLNQQPIRLVDGLRFWPMRQRGETIVRIESSSQRRFYHLGYEEYALVSLLDGKTSIAAACSVSASQLGPAALSMSQATTVVRWLLENGLATMGSETSTHAVARDASLASRLNPFWMKIPIRNANRWIDRFADGVRWLFGARAVVAVDRRRDRGCRVAGGRV